MVDIVYTLFSNALPEGLYFGLNFSLSLKAHEQWVIIDSGNGLAKMVMLGDKIFRKPMIAQFSYAYMCNHVGTPLLTWINSDLCMNK